jgi:hypothetical protein
MWAFRHPRQPGKAAVERCYQYAIRSKLKEKAMQLNLWWSVLWVAGGVAVLAATAIVARTTRETSQRLSRALVAAEARAEQLGIELRSVVTRVESAARRAEDAEGAAEELINALQPVNRDFDSCAGPFKRLDFAQSLDPNLFAEAAEKEAVAYAQMHLRDFVADSTVLTVQGIQQWAARSEMVVSASSEASKALRTGAANIQQTVSGQRLPHVINSKTKQALEVMKEVGPSRKLISTAAAASTIVVSAAHIIATAELARKLRLVDQKLDLLLAYRQIDQEAALERIYTAAKELLAGPLDEVRCMEVWRLRNELRQLRFTWRRELERHLRQIENPTERDWINRMFTVQSSQDRRIAGKISDSMPQLLMVEYSLRIDRVLAAASHTWGISELTLGDELAAIERVGDLLKEKAEFISKERRSSAQPMIDGISSLVA